MPRMLGHQLDPTGLIFDGRLCRESCCATGAIPHDLPHTLPQNFDHFKDDEDSIHPGHIIAAPGVFSSYQGFMPQARSCVYDPSAIAVRTTASRQNCSPEKPPHADGVCHGFLEGASPIANATARVKRDLSRQKNSRETGSLGENSRLVCNTDDGFEAALSFGGWGWHRCGAMLELQLDVGQRRDMFQFTRREPIRQFSQVVEMESIDSSSYT
jgi:hypothetical protein